MAKRKRSLSGLGKFYSSEQSEPMKWLTSALDNFNRIKALKDRGDSCRVIEHYTDVIAEATAASAVSSIGSAINTRAGNLAREATHAQRQAVDICRRSALKASKK